VRFKSWFAFGLPGLRFKSPVISPAAFFAAAGVGRSLAPNALDTLLVFLVFAAMS
jgi:hypothetical protein